MFQRLLQPVKAHPLITLFCIALVLRIGFLAISLNQILPAQINNLTPDWAAYVSAAQELLTNGTLNTEVVTTYGPGYPIFLFLISIFTGWQPIFALGIQIVLSSLCAIGIYKLALTLLDDRRIALVSGYLHAFNLLSISLSAGFFSETLFVSAVIGSLLLLFHSIRKQHWLSLLVASVLLSAAILTRVQGLFLPVVLLFCLILFRWISGAPLFASDKSVNKRLIIFSLVTYALVGLWVWHNIAEHNMPQVSRALPGACEKVGMFITMKQNQSTWEIEKAKFDSLLAEDVQRTGKPMYALYTGFATDYFFDAFKRDPAGAIWLLCKLAVENIHLETGHLQLQLPHWAEEVKRAESISNKKAFNYRATIFSLIGFIVLWRWKKKQQAIFLGAIYLYFALLAAFTVWQGNRIMYPAVIAWSILIAVAFVCIWDWMRERFTSGQKSDGRALPRHDTGLPDAAR